MKKRLLFLAVALLLPSALHARFGFGVGGGFCFSAAPNEFASASFRADTSPWCFGVSVHSNGAFSVSADNWVIHKKLSDTISWFALWGLSLEFRRGFSEDAADFEAAFGSRAGAGMDFFFLERRLELSSHIVWDMQAGVERTDGDLSFLFRPAHFPCSLSLRLWF